MGSGLGKAGGVVHWSVVRNMVVAWLLTLPAAGLMGALAHEGVQVFPNDTGRRDRRRHRRRSRSPAASFCWRVARDHVTSRNVLEPAARARRPPIGAGA